MKLTIATGPHATWHALTAAAYAMRFADEYPDRVGRGQSVVYHVDQGGVCMTVQAWRTPAGEISAVAEAAKPLVRIAL